MSWLDKVAQKINENHPHKFGDMLFIPHDVHTNGKFCYTLRLPDSTYEAYTREDENSFTLIETVKYIQGLALADLIMEQMIKRHCSAGTVVQYGAVKKMKADFLGHHTDNSTTCD